MLTCYYRNRLGWFRIFGFGLHWKDITIHPLMFSERIGKTKSIQFGKWMVRILKPNKI